ncbi:MAG: rRNA maturation RNase YbeY [Candidatus Eremiobacteraeota bacterium]|nr:rRNA maturation RNase YbeY [Candidatus Eremiobacteraeota bacterium]
MPLININNPQDFKLISPEKIEEIIRQLFLIAKLKDNGELSVTFMNDEGILELNKTYRNIEAPTDVLSFPQSEGLEMPVPDDENYIPLIGDIIISVETAERQAKEMNHSLERELNILLIHGLLHLYGYDHENVSGEIAQKMRVEEKRILSVLEKGGKKPERITECY